MSNHIIPPVDEDTPPIRKGRGNAILTYEALAEMANTLVAVRTKVEGIDEKVSSQARQYSDHETRIRTLELSLATMAAVATASRDRTKWLVPILVSVSAVLLAALSIYMKH